MADHEEDDKKNPKALDEEDINVLKRYVSSTQPAQLVAIVQTCDWIDVFRALLASWQLYLLIYSNSYPLICAEYWFLCECDQAGREGYQGEGKEDQ